MAELTRKTIIAKKLCDIYMSMDEYKITEIQKIIKKDIEFKEIHISEGHNPRLEYFIKRINNIHKIFMQEENIIAKKPDLIVPKPVFNMFEYTDDEIIKFLMAYIEKITSDRKTKYNSNTKIDIDNDYEIAIEIINSISYTKYENLEDIDAIYYYIDLSILWNTLNSRNTVINEHIFKYNNTFNKHSILNSLLKKYYYNNQSNTPRGLVSATMFNYYLISLIYGDNIFCNSNVNNPMKFIVQYRIIWTLFIRVIYQNFQYSCKNGIINAENFTIIIEKLKALTGEIENNKDIKEIEEDLYDGFYKYNYYLKASNINNMELICLHDIHQNEYTFIKDEDLFFDENNNLKKEYNNMKNIKPETLNKLFNSGKKSVKNETFNNNIKYCEEFIPIYNHLANRRLELDKISTMRAVYRALFVNKINHNRQTSYTISKKIITLNDKIMESQRDGADTTSDVNVTFKNAKNDARNINKTIFEDNFMLGSSISNEMMLEYPNGYNILCQKYEFMCVFNRLALFIFYKNCPSMYTHSNELIDASKKIKYYFEQVMKILYYTT